MTTDATLRGAIKVIAEALRHVQVPLTTDDGTTYGVTFIQPSVVEKAASATLHALVEAGWTVQRAGAPSPSTDIQCTTETEKTCTQPWHMDDGVPYCTTCGLYRNLIHQQETARARRK